MRLKAGKRILLDTPDLILPPKTRLVMGDNTRLPYDGIGGSVDSKLTDIHGKLQYNLAICITQLRLTIMTGGATGWTSHDYTFYDGNNNKAENIFAVFAQAYGAYSNAVTVGIEKQSSSGFTVFMRGTGVSENIIGKDIYVRLLVFHEVP